MPVLKATEHAASVTWLGRVPAAPDGIRSEPADGLALAFEGADGEGHSGLTRASCIRVRNLYTKGTEIRNVRQLSILSEENLAEIAAEMDIDRIDPTWLGASVVIKGVSDFTHVPPSSRLVAASGATLTIDMENLPCGWPEKEIRRHHPDRSERFLEAATGRRGVTAWVEREGWLTLGESLTLFVPTQAAWDP